MKASRAAIAATWPIQKRIGEPRLESRPLLGNQRADTSALLGKRPGESIASRLQHLRLPFTSDSIEEIDVTSQVLCARCCVLGAVLSATCWVRCSVRRPKVPSSPRRSWSAAGTPAVSMAVHPSSTSVDDDAIVGRGVSRKAPRNVVAALNELGIP